MTQLREQYKLHNVSITELNKIFWQLSNRLDELEGYRGQGTFRTVPKSDEQATEDDELVRYDQLDVLNPSEFTLSDTVWEDMRIPVASLKVPGSNAPTWSTFPNGTTDTGLQALHFSDQAVEGNEEGVYFTVQLPHAWKIGTDIEAHIHWSPETTGTGTVRWGFTYTWAFIDAVYGEPATVYGEHTIAENEQDKHIYTDFDPWLTTPTDRPSYKVSSMLVCKLFRNSSHANDTYTGDAALLEVDMHLEIDSLGSREELVK